ncbi:acyltransferase family protein [Listeria rocourtiae]|uniref:acyltransferase family protein n=1 Tax=Listeria rocourtiae TaxID=647910 RepID=UPI001629EDD3|nr:acyltransferase family protein [Listeria rocourtiae]MBC1605507.1 acyltransferase family protein [Listeria rocourtiae]
MTQRLDWIDTAKGIGIFLVVWGHFYASDTVKIVIYGFHMPLFFFLSGYLYKAKKIGFPSFLLKTSQKLLLPFFIFQSATLLIVNGISLIGSQQLYKIPSLLVTQFFFLDGEVGFNTPLWFLVVLFNVEILFYLFTRYLKNRQWIVVLGVFLLALILSTHVNERFAFGLHIVPLGWLFYYIGFWSSTQSRPVFKSWPVIILGAIAYLYTVFNLNAGQIAGFRSNNLGNFFAFFLGALLGIFVFCLLCQKIGKSQLWSQFGQNSLVIFGTHYFFLIFYAHFIKRVTGELAQVSYPIWMTLNLTTFAFIFYAVLFRVTRKLGITHYFFIK